jgi:hypothetical protein
VTREAGLPPNATPEQRAADWAETALKKLGVNGTEPVLTCLARAPGFRGEKDEAGDARQLFLAVLEFAGRAERLASDASAMLREAVLGVVAANPTWSEPWRAPPVADERWLADAHLPRSTDVLLRRRGKYSRRFSVIRRSRCVVSSPHEHVESAPENETQNEQLNNQGGVNVELGSPGLKMISPR